MQTYNNENEIFSLLRKHDYSTFISQQIKERKLFNYPPYNRLIKVTVKHKAKKRLNQSAEQLAFYMRKSFGSRVLGPESPIISRIRNYYHKDILLKIEQESSISKAKQLLNTIIGNLKEQTDFRSSRIIIDVDPF